MKSNQHILYPLLSIFTSTAFLSDRYSLVQYNWGKRSKKYGEQRKVKQSMYRPITDPQVFRRLRLPDVKTFCTGKW